MRATFCIIAFSFAVTGAHAQQTLDERDVPANAIKTISSECPACHPRWTRSGDRYRAEFEDPATHVRQVRVFSKDGKAIREENAAEMRQADTLRRKLPALDK